MIKQYRKKPVVIEAMHLSEPNLPSEVAKWCGGKVEDWHTVGKKVWIIIPTLEGDMRADYGDYIIKGVQGEFYPCKPDIFELTYEEVLDTKGVNGDET